MLALNEAENRHLLANFYGTESYVKVSNETYAPVRELAKQFGFIE